MMTLRTLRAAQPSYHAHMRLIVLIATATILAGCSTSQNARLREFFNLVPPVVVADATIDGQRVTLNRCQALVVRLDEDPASGQRWEMRPLATSLVIAPVRHDYAPKAGSEPGQANVAGEALFHLRGVEAGTQPVVFDYKRPLDAAAAKTIQFEVVVR